MSEDQEKKERKLIYTPEVMRKLLKRFENLSDNCEEAESECVYYQGRKERENPSTYDYD